MQMSPLFLVVLTTLVACCVSLSTSPRSQSMPFLMRQKSLDKLTLSGDVGFDPFGLSTLDVFDIYWMREAELKHSRIAMLAALGQLAQESGFVLPNFPSDKNQLDNFYSLVHTNPKLVAGSFLFIGIVELIGFFALYYGKEWERQPGDYQFNPLKFGQKETTRNDFALKEIKNGRLAMIGNTLNYSIITLLITYFTYLGVFGMLVQESLTSKGALEALASSQ